MRQRNFVTAKQAALAARLARLDYKVSGETGALRLPGKGRTWYLGNRKSAHAPALGQSWERSGPTYIVALDEVRLAKPVIHHQWRRLTAKPATVGTIE